MNALPYGLRLVGHRAGTRRLINHAAAFRACAECDPRAELDRESYLTAFRFPPAFQEHFEREATEKGYNGPCGADWLWLDLGPARRSSGRPERRQAALRGHPRPLP